MLADQSLHEVQVTVGLLDTDFLVLIVLWDNSVHRHLTFKNVGPKWVKAFTVYPRDQFTAQFSPRSSAAGLARRSIRHNEQCL